MRVRNSPLRPGTIRRVVRFDARKVVVKYRGREYPYAFDEVTVLQKKGNKADRKAKATMIELGKMLYY